MRNRFIIFIFTILAWSGLFGATTKSPHGAKMKLECITCHTTDNWLKIKEKGFNHNKTHFPLVGQHNAISCKQCHKSLVFNEAPTECSTCHTDIHEGTVGRGCQRCHKPNSWIVSNIRQIHQQQGFPLVGEHGSADCNRCHQSASSLRFNNRRADCYSCHQFQYELTSKPNHRLTGFGTDCVRCHNMTGRTWLSIGKGFDHSYFPLTGGHGNLSCNNAKCHENDNYLKKLSPDCTSCHGVSTAVAIIPAHGTKMKKYACNDCHTATTWNNVRFSIHDSWFGIYSDKHKGLWNKCTDCHNNDLTYKANCRKCHNFDR